MLYLGKIQTGRTIKFNYNVDVSGDYRMYCVFANDRQQVLTSTLTQGKELSFDTSNLNENFTYQCTILDPSGKLITFSDTENISHTSISFQTRVGYDYLTLSTDVISSIVVSTSNVAPPVTEILPNRWQSEVYTGKTWTIQYGGKIQNTSVELEAVFDENGNDIMNEVDLSTFSRDAQIIDIEFFEPVSGTIELVSNG